MHTCVHHIHIYIYVFDSRMGATLSSPSSSSLFSSRSLLKSPPAAPVAKALCRAAKRSACENPPRHCRCAVASPGHFNSRKAQSRPMGRPCARVRAERAFGKGAHTLLTRAPQRMQCAFKLWPVSLRTMNPEPTPKLMVFLPRTPEQEDSQQQ